MFRFLPREEKFFDLFEKGARNCVTGAKLLHELLKVYDRVPERVRDLKDLEHEGDKLTHETLEKLHQTFVTPFDREDIHDLICRLDDVLDLMDGAASRILLYKLPSVRPGAIRIAEVLCRQTEVMEKLVGELRRLKSRAQILPHCVEINRLENEADVAHRESLAILFNDGVDPIKVIQWKEIFELIETSTDRCEDVSDVVEAIALKRL